MTISLSGELKEVIEMTFKLKVDDFLIINH